jgi:alpha-tubulin suppressor-like RCC1 family protein
MGDCAGNFGAPATYPAGSDARWIELDHMNTDPYLDLIVPGYDGSVSILLGNSAGVFGAPMTYPAGANCNAAAVGEFTGDTCNDVLVTNYDLDNVTFFQGDCAGGLTNIQTIPVGNRAQDLVAYDFNDDGNMDWAVINRLDNTVSVFQGDGIGGFSGPVSYGVAANPFTIATGDFDNDGRMDLATASIGTDMVSVLRNITTAGGNDQDGDGLSDRAENYYGTDPLDPDSDADGLNDGEEVLTYGTDPLDPDTDGDGAGDATDCDPLNQNAWDTCLTCKDDDSDTYYELCNQYIGINGPDCDDTDENNWISCPTCADADTDNWYDGCDAYVTISGPDCGDTNQNAWDTCPTCNDDDSDTYYELCNQYVGINGPDCDDTHPCVWSACGSCDDTDGDGLYDICEIYSDTLGCPGPDCDDLNENTWDTCLTCNDDDFDTWYELCNQYIGISGPDCDDDDQYNWLSCLTCDDADGDSVRGTDCDINEDCDDADIDNWTSCLTCLDGDTDTWFIGCDAYTTRNGPDCEDANQNAWDTCLTCNDDDGDDWYELCNQYLGINGPECDDGNADVYPGAPEFCDGVDNQCAGDPGFGLVDEGGDGSRMSGGSEHSCAVLEGGSAVCWGRNWAGQLGDGSYGESWTPVQVTSIANAIGIDGGYAHSCAVLSSGLVECWGLNNHGQLGDGTNNISNTPVPVLGISDGTAISAHEMFSCGVLSSGSVSCWGNNDYGQLGNGSTVTSNMPVQVSGIPDAVGIALGPFHACAVLSGGSVACWGNNGGGRLGDGSTAPSPVPVQVVGISSATYVTAGSGHSCALLAGGSVECWGEGWTGQLGDGLGVNSPVPVEVFGISDAIDIAAGDDHSCAVLASGSVECWGANFFGELGDGTNNPSDYPVEVSGISNAYAVGSGRYHTCATLSDGLIMCWGDNGNGRLGNGTNDDSNVPVLVSDISCGLDSDGDGIGDDEETYTYFTNPNDPDTDGDGIGDYDEAITSACLNPLLADTDGDTLGDAVEDGNTNGVVDAGETDPCNPDTDGDSSNDSLDCDPLDPNNWVSCLTCADGDTDTWYLGCDAYVTINGPDCNDGDSTVNPGADEIACSNTVDENCNGMADNAPDADGDSFDLCAPSDPGEIDGRTADCNDGDSTINPGAVEIICDGADNDCNAATLEAPDIDADGWDICDSAAVGDGLTPADCNDGDSTINPGEAEIICNAIDENCSGMADDAPDVDGDTWDVCDSLTVGDGKTPADCDDGNTSVNPAHSEDLCDGLDNDCNALTLDDKDDDNDGLSYCLEEIIIGCLDDLTADTDGDGLCDGATSAGGACAVGENLDGDSVTGLVDNETDPCDPDTDGDGMDDWWEASYLCVNQLSADSASDPDGDGLANMGEKDNNTDPCDEDTDDGGEYDGSEVAAGRDPLNPLDDVLVVNIGSGSNLSYMPFPTSYYHSRAQYIYLASQIGADGVIKSIAFDIFTVPGEPMNLSIRMRHTTLSSYTSPYNWEAGWTTVYYNGSENIGSTGWYRFDLQTPFLYNGTDNLMVDVSFSNGSISTDGLVRTSINADDRMLWYRTNTNYGNPLTWDGTDSPVIWVTSSTANLRLEMTPVTLDTDGDGLPDVWENTYSCMQANTVDNLADYDSDALTGQIEFIEGTDPCNPDTDGDGMEDGWEVSYPACMDPLVGDSLGDPDGDTFTNLEEYQAGGHPCIITACDDGLDNDADGLVDFPADPDCLSPADIAELKPVLDGSTDTPGRASSVFLDDNYAYVSDWDSGIQIIDVSDPQNPTFMGSAGLPWVTDVYVRNGYLYDSDYEGISEGFNILEVSDPANPTWVGGETVGNSNGIFISGPYAFVSGSSFSLKILDILDPADPTLVSNFPGGGGGSQGYVNNGYFYITRSSGGLDVIDVSDPGNPNLAGNYNPVGWARGLYFRDDYVFLADGDSGLQIIDVSDPPNPTPIGYYVTSNHAGGVSVSGNLAFVSITYSGIEIINISDPANPILAGWIDTTDSTSQNVVRGNYLYVSDRYDGIKIINIAATDSDSDGMPNHWELYYYSCMQANTVDNLLDYDGDTITNEDEFLANTDPCDTDTDADGMDDGWEMQHIACVNPISGDSIWDSDGDGLSNLGEYNGESDPCDPSHPVIYGLDVPPLMTPADTVTITVNVADLDGDVPVCTQVHGSLSTTTFPELNPIVLDDFTAYFQIFICDDGLSGDSAAGDGIYGVTENLGALIAQYLPPQFLPYLSDFDMCLDQMWIFDDAANQSNIIGGVCSHFENHAPVIYGLDVPPLMTPADTVTITVNVADLDNDVPVCAQVHGSLSTATFPALNPIVLDDFTAYFQIFICDDGLSGDSAAGDGIYGVTENIGALIAQYLPPQFLPYLSDFDMCLDQMWIFDNAANRSNIIGGICSHFHNPAPVIYDVVFPSSVTPYDTIDASMMIADVDGYSPNPGGIDAPCINLFGCITAEIVETGDTVSLCYGDTDIPGLELLACDNGDTVLWGDTSAGDGRYSNRVDIWDNLKQHLPGEFLRYLVDANLTFDLWVYDNEGNRSNIITAPVAFTYDGDYDHDGVMDWVEMATGFECLDPENPDTDGDGLCDGMTAMWGATILCPLGVEAGDTNGVCDDCNTDTGETDPCQGNPIITGLQIPDTISPEAIAHIEATITDVDSALPDCLLVFGTIAAPTVVPGVTIRFEDIYAADPEADILACNGGAGSLYSLDLDLWDSIFYTLAAYFPEFLDDLVQASGAPLEMTLWVFDPEGNISTVTPVTTTFQYDGDYDDDGVLDEVEFTAACFNPENPDTDGDGLCDGATAVYDGATLLCSAGENLDGDTAVDPGETDPCNPDTDGDLSNDGGDCEPLNPDVYPGSTELCDGIDNQCPGDAGYGEVDEGCLVDTDGDGIDDAVEDAYCTSSSDPDSDGDGLCDGNLSVGSTCVAGEDMNADGVVDPAETDPCNPDTDGDGLTDGDEVTIYLTDARLWDTDGDYMPDLYEVQNTGQTPPLNPFDPSDGDTCFEQPSFEDINPNYHEYWNGTDPWNTDPVPLDPRDPACFYWGDADGDGFVANNDKLILGNAIIGLFTDYSVVIPDNGDSQDLDADDVVAGGDLIVLQNFIINAPVGLVISRAVGLEKVYEPAAAIEVGGTTHVTVKVRADNTAINLYQGSFAVVFEIDPSSTGSAVLLGGEGVEAAGRYDVSGYSAQVDGGFATMHFKITGAGTITVNARVPACGTSGVGRWCNEVVLSPALTITAVDP